MDETGLYRYAGAVDYIFVGKVREADTSITEDDDKSTYLIQVSENLKGELVEEVECSKHGGILEDGTMLLYESDKLKDSGRAEKSGRLRPDTEGADRDLKQEADMRTEKEMFRIIIDTAKSDGRILAAYLKGSRANPNVLPDIYQDFDIMYVVEETRSFREDTSWMQAFGTVILKQEQDEAFGYGERFGLQKEYDKTYSWLLLFDDGNRIDIGVETLETMKNGSNRNKLFLPLLDKAGCLPKLPPPTDEEFHIRRPAEARFQGCCKEFFWSLCDVAKGILRDELPFAMTTYHTQPHHMLETMLGWYIGSQTEYSVSCGKQNKYFKKYLPEELYELYLQTFPDSSYEHFWRAVGISCRLFRRTAVQMADSLGTVYPEEYEKGFRKYMELMGPAAAWDAV